MSVNSIVDRIWEEINGKNRKDEIVILEEMLIQNIDELSENYDFFHLPLTNIFSIISKIDFSSISEKNSFFKIFVKNTIRAHFEEKETLFLLSSIDTTNSSHPFDEILLILENFTNCPFLYHFDKLYKEKRKLPETDYEYELKQKDKEIEKLNQQIKDLKSKAKITFQPVLTKPKDFEPDIFIACIEGKLTSVQWLIEKENVDKNKRVETYNFHIGLNIDETPIHLASKKGHLSIVQYLIEMQNVDINIKNMDKKTPLHYACEYGHLSIVEYLISKGADINIMDYFGDFAIHIACAKGYILIVRYLIEKQNVDINIKNGNLVQTPLHSACLYGHYSVVDYLISKGANIEAKNKFDWTPLHYATNFSKTDIVTLLISKGANINAKTNNGKMPINLARTDIIRNILK